MMRQNPAQNPAQKPEQNRKPRDTKGTILRLFKTMMDARALFLLAVVLTLSGTMLGLLGPQLAGDAIDAIGAAEGFTRDTAKKKVYLIHQDEPQSLIKINLNNMLRTGDMSENYVMREGDLLYMTRNNRIDFARDIAPILSSIYMITEVKDNLDNN